MRTRQALAVVFLAALCWSGAAISMTAQDPPAALKFTVILRWVGADKSGADKWELYVENTNLVKFINTFRWVPPTGLQVKAITNAGGGKCRLSDGIIMCSGNIAPESCSSCEGGGMTIEFTGNGFDPVWVPTDGGGGYWFSQGWTPGGVTVTSTSSFTDLPLCAKGHVSTKKKPCAKR
jgi:hypothetical protein